MNSRAHIFDRPPGYSHILQQSLHQPSGKDALGFVTDKWCVTWKIYRTNGEYLPHHALPNGGRRPREAIHSRRRGDRRAAGRNSVMDFVSVIRRRCSTKTET